MGYTIHELHEKLIQKEISSVELTRQFIAHRQQVEGDIHAFLSVNDEEALKQAAAVDAKIAAGEKIAALAGIPEQSRITLSSEDRNVQRLPVCWKTGHLLMMQGLLNDWKPMIMCR